MQSWRPKEELAAVEVGAGVGAGPVLVFLVVLMGGSLGCEWSIPALGVLRSLLAQDSRISDPLQALRCRGVAPSS